MSLRSKDRAEAKLRIPAHTVETDKLLADAMRSLVTKPNRKAVPPRSAAQIERDRNQWERDQQQADDVADGLFVADMEADLATPVIELSLALQ